MYNEMTDDQLKLACIQKLSLIVNSVPFAKLNYIDKEVLGVAFILLATLSSGDKLIMLHAIYSALMTSPDDVMHQDRIYS